MNKVVNLNKALIVNKAFSVNESLQSIMLPPMIRILPTTFLLFSLSFCLCFSVFNFLSIFFVRPVSCGAFGPPDGLAAPLFFRGIAAALSGLWENFPGVALPLQTYPPWRWRRLRRPLAPGLFWLDGVGWFNIEYSHGLPGVQN